MNNNCKVITKFEEGVHDLSNSFENFYELSECAEIPDSVSNMIRTFSNCESLIYPPNSISKNIINMDSCFHNCINLRYSPSLNKSIKLISMIKAFYHCINLIDVSIMPNNVKYLDYTFYECYNILRIPNLPESLSTMGHAFARCFNLSSIPEIPNNVYDLESAFEDCYNLKLVERIPKSAKYLNNTFKNCSNLKTPNNSITIGKEVLSMRSTFAGCRKLEGDIYIESENVRDALCCFDDCSVYSKRIHVPYGTTTYRKFYKAMGNSTYCKNWNAALVEL
jgi:hypothetical protein